MVLVGKINLQENVKEYMLNVHNIAIESEYEDDGLYMITIWFTDDQIGYIAISRDLQGSCPEKIYFEWGDQSNGRFIEEFSYSFDNLILKLDLNDPSFPQNIVKIDMDISDFNKNDIDRVLREILRKRN